MKRSQRGFTLAEILTVLVIMGLMLSVVAFCVPLFLNGPREAQSQVDNVESAALALYKMQHDTRPSNINNVWSCTTVLVPVCTQPTPGPSMPTAQAVVILTAANGAGQFVLNGNGTPDWQGFDVYWITPNADGSSNELRRAFVGAALPSPGPADALTALTTALGLTTYTTVAQDVWDMKFAVDTTTNTVDLELDGGDTKGNMSSLRLAGNSYVRN